VNFTPSEAVAMAMALPALADSPFHVTAAAALRKLVAAMGPDDAAAARDMAGRIHLVGHGAGSAPVPRLVADALAAHRVLRIRYADRAGAATVREIEPMGYVGTRAHWYLVAWCRLRDQIRAFRTDRITSATVTAEVPPPRPLAATDLDIPPDRLRPLSLV
jgi:predicted DNA-binding transcriptional regulator YafY